MQQRRPQSSVMVGLLSLAVLVGVALTNSPAQADTGAGPYYAPPSWDGTLPSAARFMVLTNFASAAVLDRETGMVWERSPAATTATWLSARETCIDKIVGGRKGWRVPSVFELASLIDPSVAFETLALPTGHPFLNVQSGGFLYWSATTVADGPTTAWDMDFRSPGDMEEVTKDSDQRFWCARGGMNADQY